MVSRRKLKCYDAKSLKLLYLLMLAVFPYEADLRTVKADQQQLALALWSPLSKTRGLSTMHNVQTTRNKMAVMLRMDAHIN